MEEYALKVNYSGLKIYPLLTRFVGKIGYRINPKEFPSINRIFIKGADTLKEVKVTLKKNNIPYRMVKV